MIISAHQPAYNPWLGYVHKLLLSDVFVIMDDVQFEKNSFINRNKILQKNTEIMLTIPVKTKDYKSKSIRQIEVLQNNWQIKHLKSIEQAYKKSKNFDLIFPELVKIYNFKSPFLIDYTNTYLNFIINYLEIETQIVYASNLKIESKKLDYICELTHKLKGRTFIFGSQGKEYANEQYLFKHGIIPYFQEYNHPKYEQASNEFSYFMGIIDLLFNEEKYKIKEIILSNNITKNDIRKINA